MRASKRSASRRLVESAAAEDPVGPQFHAAHWLAGLDEPAWLVDARSQRVLQANPAAAGWLGQPLHSLAGRSAEDMLPTLEDAAFWAELRRRDEGIGAVAGGGGGRASLVSDTELVGAGGRVAQVTRRIEPIGEPGRPQAYLVQLHDRSAERRSAEERDTLLAELRATLEASADGILVLDTSGRIRAFNRRFALLWELPEAALAGRCDEAVLDWMRLTVAQPAAYQARLDEIAVHMLLSARDRLTLRNGSVLERHTQPQWSAGRPIGRVYSFRLLPPDSRALPQPEPALAGSPAAPPTVTRWELLAILDAAVDRARSEGAPLALLCVEYDRQALFAADGLGRAHAVSELLEGLRACVREPHWTACLGAGRFAVLLRQSGQAGAEQVAERLVALASQPAQGILASQGLSVKVGVAVYPQAGLGGLELLSQAELAVQRACAETGARWLLATQAAQATPDSRRQLRLEAAIRQGLAGSAFRLHYQPRFDPHSGQVQAIEALLRWQDPEDGLLLPDQFIRLAERAGMMVALDDWVLEQALRQSLRWLAAGHTQSLTVNVSGASLSQPAYARRVAALLEATAWPAARLELDVTEQAIQRDPESALCNLQALHRLGVRIHLDQWGLGDTAVGLLRRFPFDAVKTERSLLRRVPLQAAETRFLQALFGIALALGRPVLAMGVERESQRQFLLQAGCVGWQGQFGAAPRDHRSTLRGLRTGFGTAPLPCADAAPQAALG